jgi:hypothetical protein
MCEAMGGWEARVSPSFFEGEEEKEELWRRKGWVLLGFQRRMAAADWMGQCDYGPAQSTFLLILFSEGTFFGTFVRGNIKHYSECPKKKDYDYCVGRFTISKKSRQSIKRKEVPMSN